MPALGPHDLDMFAGLRGFDERLLRFGRHEVIVPRRDDDQRAGRDLRYPVERLERVAVDEQKGSTGEQAAQEFVFDVSLAHVHDPRHVLGAAVQQPDAREPGVQRPCDRCERHAEAGADEFNLVRVHPGLLQRPVEGQRHRRRRVQERLLDTRYRGERLPECIQFLVTLVGIVEGEVCDTLRLPHKIDCVFSCAFSAHHDDDRQRLARLGLRPDHAHIHPQACRRLQPDEFLYDAVDTRLGNGGRHESATTLDEVVAFRNCEL